MSRLPCLFFFLLTLFLPHPSSATDFLFNGFDPANLTLYGDATVESGHRYLSLTNTSTSFSIGRALFNSKIPTGSPATNSSSSPSSARLPLLPFHASFLFSIAPIRGILPGHGIAFLFSPTRGVNGATAAQHLGLFNRSTDRDPANRVLAVEFDVFENQEFSDINDNHVGVDLYSLTSVAAHPAGYWPDSSARETRGSSSSSFVDQVLKDGSNYQAWVDYADGRLNVTMAPVSLGRKPRRPLISVDLDLSDVFLEEMYIGFCAATGRLVEHHRILGWSFSNSNSSHSEGLITTNLPNFILSEHRHVSKSKGFVAGISAAAIAIFLITLVSLLLFWWRRRRRNKREEEEIGGSSGGGGVEAAPEGWELEYWPHRIGYREISVATDGFSDRSLIGCGGNGRVYKGVLGGVDVAVKLFSRSTGEEARQFLAEVSSLGRLKHRNLVGLKGWCRKKDGGDLILVYDYMENGSLDKRIFPEGGGGQEGPEPLDWGSRVRILKDVAAGVLYLHEGWESRVLHRDIKTSNVLLDGGMNGRLGDFGLARMHPHGRAMSTTRVVGSVGYMAPEVVRTGKATTKTDVYGFGVLVLEVVCGRRPVEAGRPPLIEWVWELMECGEMLDAVDPRLRRTEGFDDGEAGRVVQVGLMCTCVEPSRRPTMRQVVRALEGTGAVAHGTDGSDEKSYDVEACLLERLRSMEMPMMWSKKQQHGGRSGSRRMWWSRQHLTFEELRQLMSNSTSLSESDIIVDGR